MAASGSPAPDRTRSVVATIAALVGLVFALQGAGALPGSFMTGDPVWLVIGVGLIALALASIAWPLVRGR